MTKADANRYRLLANPRADRTAPYRDESRLDILSLDKLRLASAEITSWRGYAPTPVHSLGALARENGVAALLYKDESSRFGLGSFKALGGAYAVLRLLQDETERRTGRKFTSAELQKGDASGIVGEMTVTCATDGNHGKSVAWGARTFGCRCVIFVHSDVSAARRAAIAGQGAEVREVRGTYDEAVRQAALDAAANGWHVVSDTSYEGYTDVPRDVMQGYGLILEEAYRQWPPSRIPTHIFVQGGVGGLAAALCAYLWETFEAKRPVFVLAEPARADCLYRSAAAGRPTPADGDLKTIMAGLACGEVSLIGWKILDKGADAFMTIEDEAAKDVMCRLASPSGGDPAIAAGESAVAGLAAFRLAAAQPDARRALRLDEHSVVLVIGTEGATDPSLYAAIVGASAETVRARASQCQLGARAS